MYECLVCSVKFCKSVPIILNLFVCLFVCLSGDYSHIIGHKGLEFSEFEGGTYNKFGEVWFVY